MKRFTLIAIVCLLICGCSFGTNLVVNPSFETIETTSGGWPINYGDWKGEYSAIIGASEGITPYEGSQMLQFKGTSFGGAGSGTECVLFQIVDVSSKQTLIASGNAIANAGAYYNSLNFDSHTDNDFSLIILAYEGEASTFASRWTTERHASTLSYVSTHFTTDNDVNTWEKGSTFLALPANTDFIVLAIAATENIYNDNIYPEFDGHFADAISVEIVPEPTTLALFALGGILIKKRK